MILAIRYLASMGDTVPSVFIITVYFSHTSNWPVPQWFLLTEPVLLMRRHPQTLQRCRGITPYLRGSCRSSDRCFIMCFLYGNAVVTVCVVGYEKHLQEK